MTEGLEVLMPRSGMVLPLRDNQCLMSDFHRISE